MTAPKKKRIDKETTRTARALALLHKLRDSQRRVHLSDLRDGEFGCDKTVGRLIGDLNGSWDIFRGGPLIKLEKVEHDGKRDKALILIDEIPEVSSAKSLIHLPVIKNFLSNLKGTTVADQIEERLSRSINALSAKGKSTMKSLDRKFIHVSKGEVQYNLIFEILDNVIDALVREKLLKVSVQRDEGIKTYTLKPLALLWMNSNLYLAAYKGGEVEGKQPYTWAVEGFLEAEVLAEGFTYPKGLELGKQFEAPYGLLKGKSVHNVVLSFDNRYDIRRTLEYRRFGENQTLVVEDDCLMLRFQTNNLDELCPWILGWSDLVEVCGPKSLREMVAERLLATLAYYPKTS